MAKEIVLKSKLYGADGVEYRYNYDTQILDIPCIVASVKLSMPAQFDETLCLKFFDCIYAKLSSALTFINASVDALTQAGVTTYNIEESAR